MAFRVLPSTLIPLLLPNPTVPYLPHITLDIFATSLSLYTPNIFPPRPLLPSVLEIHLPRTAAWLTSSHLCIVDCCLSVARPTARTWYLLKEWVSPSPLSPTTPWCWAAQGGTTQIDRHAWTQTHGLPLGAKARPATCQAISLAPSAPLQFLPCHLLHLWLLRRKKKKRFLWGIPINY